MDIEKELNIESFLAANKSMIVAPAGHGKTHTIVDCMEHFQFKDKKILILTHTHAGIASIKTKLSDRNIQPKTYELNTICSFTLNLALAYVPQAMLPDDSDMSKKYSKTLEFTMKLVLAQPIKSVLRAKYGHVIIDEYQDCDIAQHQFINALGGILKVHILGDAMQSIFDFNGTPVDLNSAEFDAYKENLQVLSTPWRWNNAGAPGLGDEILQIRGLLEKKQDIDLRQFKHIQFIQTQKNDLYWHKAPNNELCPEVLGVIRNYLSKYHKGNVLIIHPITHSKETRKKIIKNLYNIGMLESIDDKDFYDSVHDFENKVGNDLVAAILGFLRETCNASCLGDWFRENGTLKKIKKMEKLPVSLQLRKIIDPLNSQKSPSIIQLVISQIISFLNIKVVRKDVFYTIQRVLIDAGQRNITLSESLKINRDKVRRIGRAINGKYIGTTLLTKGLECETVIVLNAHQFPDEKHLYVALSRCSTRLIVASEKPILHPYKESTQPTVTPQLSLFSEEDFNN